MYFRTTLALLLLFAVGINVAAAENPASLEALQKELASLKQKMKSHTGTAVVDRRVELIETYSNYPSKRLGSSALAPTAQPPKISKLIAIYKIVKVVDGPLIRKPNQEFRIETPLFSKTIVLYTLDPNKVERVKVKYSLVIKDGEITYNFSPIE